MFSESNRHLLIAGLGSRVSGACPHRPLPISWHAAAGEQRANASELYSTAPQGVQTGMPPINSASCHRLQNAGFRDKSPTHSRHDSGSEVLEICQFD